MQHRHLWAPSPAFLRPSQGAQRHSTVEDAPPGLHDAVAVPLPVFVVGVVVVARAPGRGRSSPYHVTVDTLAELMVFETLTDVVVAFDAELRVKYANPFTRRLLRLGDTDVEDQSLVDFIHPDDLERAAEVAGLIVDETLGGEVTPAVYRLRAADGEWIPVEVNGTQQLTEGPLAGLIVIVGRYSGDNVLQDRILALLTSGAALTEVVELLPEFGLWRYPDAHYAVLYPDGAGGHLRLGSEGAVSLVDRFADADTPWSRAAADGEARLVVADDLPDELREAAASLDLRGCMVVPVRDPGSDQSAIAIGWSSNPGQHVAAHRYSLERMARALELILQWQSHLTDLQRAAELDALTGSANRATFFRRFERALALADGHDRVAVLYVDLDGFKAVNDSAGHALGDAVISAAADRMRSVVRASDLVARIGGDEFAILCDGVADITEVTAMADRIVEALAAPFEHLDGTVSIGASIGIAIADAGELDHEALLASADRALYAAKAAGKGRWLLADDAR
jgi:diguanylate cyclase (GGDEF)-like protein/PAS domain S-box-containing protein